MREFYNVATYLFLFVLLRATLSKSIEEQQQQHQSSNEESSSKNLSCPEPFVSSLGEHEFDQQCYFIAGSANSFRAASVICEQRNGLVLTVSNDRELMNLPKLYKSNPNYYIWLGAVANASNRFHWQDGSPLNDSYWCSGHPKPDYLCTYYTRTMPLFGGNEHCIYSGKCEASFFKHTVICHIQA